MHAPAARAAMQPGSGHIDLGPAAHARTSRTLLQLGSSLTVNMILYIVFVVILSLLAIMLVCRRSRHQQAQRRQARATLAAQAAGYPLAPPYVIDASWVALGATPSQQRSTRTTTRVPTPVALIHALPTFTYTGKERAAVRGDGADGSGADEDTADVCAICCCEYEAGKDECKLLPCMHSYHTECIDAWLACDHTCPLCKRSLLPHAEVSGGVDDAAGAHAGTPPPFAGDSGGGAPGAAPPASAPGGGTAAAPSPAAAAAPGVGGAPQGAPGSDSSTRRADQMGWAYLASGRAGPARPTLPYPTYPMWGWDGPRTHVRPPAPLSGQVALDMSHVPRT